MTRGEHEERRHVRLALESIPALLALAAGVVAVSIVLDEPWWTIWLLFVPAAVAALPLAVPAGRTRRIARIVAAALLVIWCLLALASVGLFYIPAALAMLIAAIRNRGS
jgi:hypothetical protein